MAARKKPAAAPVEEAPASAPADRRADYIRALTEELEGVERYGKDDRAKAIKAEIQRARSAPIDRKSPEGDEA